MFLRLARLMPLALLGLTAGLTGCLQNPVLSVTPAALSFGVATETQTVRIANASTRALTWTATSNDAWLAFVDRDNGGVVATLSGSTTTEVDILEVKVNRALLPQGVKKGSFGITSNGGDRTVNVSIDQANPAQLVLSATSVSFGATDEDASVVVSNTGIDPLVWNLTVSAAAPWLNATQKTGTIPAGSTQILSLTADRGTLAAGTYDGTISITSNGGNATITASMQVPPFTVTPNSIDFGTIESAESASITLNNKGFAPINLTVSTSTSGGGNWLSTDVSSLMLAETTPSSIVLTASPAGVPPGDFTGTVTISQTGTGFSATVEVSISITAVVASPTVVNFGIIDTPQTETVTLTNLDTTSIPFTVTKPALDAWLTVTPASGTLTSTVVLTLTGDPTVVAPGEYTSAVTISFDGGEIKIPVTIGRPKPPELKVVPNFIDFGTSRVEELVGIWNGGIGTINWRIDTNGLPPWLILSPVDGLGIASGTVSGTSTDALEVRVDRDLAPLDQVNFAETFAVEASGDFTGTVSVNVKMTVPLLPEIVVEADGQDANGVPFINFAPVVQNKTFIIRNEGRGPLMWNFDLSQKPDWISGIAPSQGTLESNTEQSVVVTVDRSSLDFTGAQTTLSILSNDPIISAFPLLVEVQVPRFIAIGARPSSLEFGLTDNTRLIEFANVGDPDTILNYQVRPSKEWLAIYPETGASEGTAGLEKDFQLHTVTVNRALLDDAGGTANLIVEAFVIENGMRVPLPTVQPLEIPVSVEAAPLTFENPLPGLRVPSLVRTPLLLRNLRYQPIAISQTRMDDLARQVSLFENDAPVEATESNQFIKPIRFVEKASALILLDYSNSMQAAAQNSDDPTISGAPDPIQALYARTVANLIAELPDFYQIGLGIFNERTSIGGGSGYRSIFGTAGEPVNMRGDLFIKDRAALLNRLNNIVVVDNGASPLFSAIIDAALTMRDEDLNPFSIPFDDSTVRSLIVLTDGRVTTPPGTVQEVVDVLQTLRVQFLCVGWGNNVFTAPLVQLATESGGHFYATRNAPTGAFDAFGTPIRRPVVAEVEDWLATVPADECDQSISKDLASMVLFNYVTLNEEGNVSLEGKLTFNDPTDQNSACIAEQGDISGSFEAAPLNYLSIAGDPRLGQISIRSDEGVRPDGTATLLVKMEAAPRNISRLEFQISTVGANPLNPANVTLVSRSNGGLMADWNRTVSGATYTFASPDGTPLRYADFGDILEINVTGAIPGFRLDFDITNPVISPSNPDSKYFTYPDSITLLDDAFKATAFPKAAIRTNPPLSSTSPRVIDAGTTAANVDVFITNRGGSHLPTGAQLEWEFVFGENSSGFLIPVTPGPYVGAVASTFDEDVFRLRLERCALVPGVYGTSLSRFDDDALPFNFKFNFGTINVEYESEFVFVTYEVLPPQLAVSSPDVNLSGTGNVIDFGGSTTEVRLNVTNAGQSTLNWDIAFENFPNWITLTNAQDSTCPGEIDTVRILVERANVTVPNQIHTFDVSSNGGTETITVVASPSP